MESGKAEVFVLEKGEMSFLHLTMEIKSNNKSESAKMLVKDSTDPR